MGGKMRPPPRLWSEKKDGYLIMRHRMRKGSEALLSYHREILDLVPERRKQLFSVIQPGSVRTHNNVSNMCFAPLGKSPGVEEKLPLDIQYRNSNTDIAFRFSRYLVKLSSSLNPDVISSVPPGLDVPRIEYNGTVLTFTSNRLVFTGVGEESLGHHIATCEFYRILREMRVPVSSDKGVVSFRITNSVTTGILRYRPDLAALAAAHPWIRYNKRLFSGACLRREDWDASITLFPGGAFNVVGAKTRDIVYTVMGQLASVVPPFLDHTTPGHSCGESKKSLEDLTRRAENCRVLLSDDEKE